MSDIGGRVGPRFLCIGAAKCGTSWLDANLRKHPQIWLPPVKELRYFDQYDADRGRPLVLRSRRARRAALRYLGRQALQSLKGAPPRDLGWRLRYYLSPTSPAWYRSLFPAGERVSGECSPTYSRLSIAAIERVRRAAPGARLIYLMRNPILRDWSHAAMNLASKHASVIDTETDSQIMKRLQMVKRMQASDYLANIRRWESVFGPDRFLFGFLEEIAEEPGSFLRRVFEFLGVDASMPALYASAHEKVGAGRYSRIPEKFLALLAARHHDRIVAVHERFDNAYTRDWLQFAANHRPSASH